MIRIQCGEPGDGNCEFSGTNELKDQVATMSCSWSCIDRRKGSRREE